MGCRAWVALMPVGPRAGRQGLPQDNQFLQPPKPYVPMPIKVMRSPAFMRLGIHARRFLDVLILENAKDRRQNGRLIATYDQLVKTGISRRKISGARAELEIHGLMRRTVIGSGNRRTGDRKPSLYRLTFFGTEDMGPTDEWRAYIASKRLPKKRPPMSKSGTL